MKSVITTPSITLATGVHYYVTTGSSWPIIFHSQGRFVLSASFPLCQVALPISEKSKLRRWLAQRQRPRWDSLVRTLFTPAPFPGPRLGSSG